MPTSIKLFIIVIVTCYLLQVTITFGIFSNAVLDVLQEKIDKCKQETPNDLTDIIDKITTNILR
ncbi:hypothetical protein [Mammaliicoccus fleurettii]|uniref:hypothetical protein n=1 Tax=Mammaliicoccus fleurettii TaxID=150056 RepID=UPI000E1C3C61|nr:hypothetical protein [Mammaliicoccus fleurettii]